MHSVTMRMTISIKPTPVVKTDRVHDKCISLPLTSRVPIPRRVGILRKRSAIHPDLAVFVKILVEHQHPARNLNDLKWSLTKRDARQSGGITVESWIIISGLTGIGLEPLLAPRRHRNRLERTGAGILVVCIRVHQPNARNVR